MMTSDSGLYEPSRHDPGVSDLNGKNNGEAKNASGTMIAENATPQKPERWSFSYSWYDEHTIE